MKKNEKGFLLCDRDSVYTDVSYLSLKISLRSYVSTFKDFRRNINQLVDGDLSADNYPLGYIENYCEAIMHFQHFVELFIKSILREEVHELFVVNALRDPLVLYKLINNEHCDKNDLNKLYQIEFSEALNTICTLISNKKIDSKYSFIKKFELQLKEINTLRNRIIHRGIYILDYIELDYLFGKYLIPFVKNASIVDSFLSEYIQRSIDDLQPYLEIINHFLGISNSKDYDLKKIGVLKEIIRSMDEFKVNPIFIPMSCHNSEGQLEEIKFDLFASDTNKKLDYLTKCVKEKVLDGYGALEVKECPVCKRNTLLVSWEREIYEDDLGKPIGIHQYVDEICCENCSFQLSSVLSDVKIEKFDLEKYFKTT